MAIFKTFCALLVSINLFASMIDLSDLDKRHILFLLSTEQTTKAIDQYLALHEKTGQHDFDILKEMCQIIFDIGSMSPDLDDQLLTLYGIQLSGNTAPTHFLEAAIKSRFAPVQGAALALLANMHEDISETLINMALKSDFLWIRFEALQLLSARKSSQALGQIKSFANLLRDEYRPMFVELYAMNGSYEAVQALRQMIGDKDTNVRTASILYSALYHRDDLLPSIQATLTHSNPEIKETAAYALGLLGDLSSIQNLEATAGSPFPETKLAALLSLYKLGQKKTFSSIEALARNGNLFAINILGDLPEDSTLLRELLHHVDGNIRLNAALALLKKRDPKCLPYILEILESDISSIGFAPFVSAGRSLVAWRVHSISSLPSEELKKNLRGVSLHFQEDLLSQLIELPAPTFLQAAKSLMRSKQTKLIPLLIRLLENESSPEIKNLITEKAYGIGNPLLRAYCKLALYRLHTNERDTSEFLKWLSSQKGTDLIRFRQTVDRNTREESRLSNFALSPEEMSLLLIESFDALAKKHDPAGIKLILETMRDGHEKNRFALSGLLLKSIQ